MKRKPQTEMVLDYMRQFGSITPLDAHMDLGILRLSARIADLRKAGHKIESKMEVVKNRYGANCNVARYRLAGGEQ